MIQGGLLSIDPSHETGWAYGLPTDRLPTVGRWLLPKGTWVRRAAALEHDLGDFLKEWQPRQIVVELPLPPLAQTHTLSALSQYSLHTVVMLSAFWVSVPVFGVSAQTVRYELLGRSVFSGTEVKRQVIAFCRRQGIRSANDNECDAALQWLW